MMARWIAALVFACSCGTGMPANCPADEPSSCPASAPSYTNDVAPLIQQYCVNQCHNPAGSASTPLASWGAIHTDQQTVLDEIYSCMMPQAGAPVPTTAERVTLLTWFACGAPNN